MTVSPDGLQVVKQHGYRVALHALLKLPNLSNTLFTYSQTLNFIIAQNFHQNTSQSNLFIFIVLCTNTPTHSVSSSSLPAFASKAIWI